MKRNKLVLSLPVLFALSGVIGHAQSVRSPGKADSRSRPPAPVPPPIVIPAPVLSGSGAAQSNSQQTPQPSFSPSPVQSATRPVTLDRVPSSTSVPGNVQPSSTTLPSSQSPLNLLGGNFIPRMGKPLPVPEFHSRVVEAERLLKSKPALTSFSTLGLSTVRMAVLAEETGRIHIVTVSKDQFLLKGAQVPLITSLGQLVRLDVIRANGVNTAVTVFDQNGGSYVPLVVEYPIERLGSVREIAYYTSAHPALLSPEVVKTGEQYVRTALDGAASRLRSSGVFISPVILDAAERLCVVEHTDHDRFIRENRITLFNEIYSLYALNEMDTYRYSVSGAGAGGMVQMIPSTYHMLRNMHPLAGLMPDFVAGMRNHANALEAMLLYMQDTWNDLQNNPEVAEALISKTAAPSELIAAGYNSNPAKLPQYLRRGGTAWRTLIPRETQIYLQIYQSVDSLIPMKPHA